MPRGAIVGLSILLAAGVLVVVVGRRAVAGRLGRNYLVGIRTTETLSSDASWSAGHRRREEPDDRRARSTGGRAPAAPATEQWRGGRDNPRQYRVAGGLGDGCRVAGLASC
ncbi:MAG: SdpI family protein [Acidimicrobiia bacterium]|nr:SdpI family protein [Acidimicrobiia bacterium]